ncbi:MAG: 5-formyltetrahydrofolate cyclo-ligase [Actinomycetota bacterium]|nr:5-formyltetrahydrofolate cyclo-ligase [Actinomycetota bacterium]
MAADPGPVTDKASWRKRLRQLRVEPEQEAEEQIVAGLKTFLDQRTGLFLFYRPMRTEISLDGLADELGWERFAVTRTPQSGGLTVHSAAGLTEQHRYGYTQPLEDADEVSLERISVVLVPGLGFDWEGNRLGQGAGYYDELLARIPDRCIRVGVATQGFIFEKLPTEPHDVPMTHLASESGVKAVAKPSL